VVGGVGVISGVGVAGGVCVAGSVGVAGGVCVAGSVGVAGGVIVIVNRRLCYKIINIIMKIENPNAWMCSSN